MLESRAGGVSDPFGGDDIGAYGDEQYGNDKDIRGNTLTKALKEIQSNGLPWGSTAFRFVAAFAALLVFLICYKSMSRVLNGQQRLRTEFMDYQERTKESLDTMRSHIDKLKGGNDDMVTSNVKMGQLVDEISRRTHDYTELRETVNSLKANVARLEKEMASELKEIEGLRRTVSQLQHSGSALPSPEVDGTNTDGNDPRDPRGRGVGRAKRARIGEGLNTKQKQVREAFKWAWEAYRAHAWGKDELHPISKSYDTWFNLGLTLIDSLDVMLIMGLREEFDEARGWVHDSLSFEQSGKTNLFECTIRVLGGLLSTYHLSGDKMFLEKAIDLGDRLIVAFKTPSGVPYSDVDLKARSASPPTWTSDSSLAETTTIQLEFKYLSYLTGNKAYAEKADRVIDIVDGLEKDHGLVPIYINTDSGRFSGRQITLGARGDSYYEYLLKMWLQTGKKVDKYRRMYDEAVNGIMSELVRESKPNGLTYIAEKTMHQKDTSPKMDHLVCFLPGLLALGHHNGFPESHLDLAKKLMRTCYEMYLQMPLKLAPEIAHFNVKDDGKGDIIVKDNDAHNLLRPETVESLFVMYRLTKDETYREWGWEIFQAFEKHARIPSGGYSSISSVKESSPRYRDKMESFFLGETLKYLFLLFEDDDSKLPLDVYVFNTEAHPLPIIDYD